MKTKIILGCFISWMILLLFSISVFTEIIQRIILSSFSMTNYNAILHLKSMARFSALQQLLQHQHRQLQQKHLWEREEEEEVWMSLNEWTTFLPEHRAHRVPKKDLTAQNVGVDSNGETADTRTALASTFNIKEEREKMDTPLRDSGSSCSRDQFHSISMQ